MTYTPMMLRAVGIYVIENFLGSNHFALNYNKEPIEKMVITVGLKISLSELRGVFFPPFVFSVCIHLSACLDCNCFSVFFFSSLHLSTQVLTVKPNSNNVRNGNFPKPSTPLLSRWMLRTAFSYHQPHTL